MEETDRHKASKLVNKMVFFPICSEALNKIKWGDVTETGVGVTWNKPGWGQDLWSEIQPGAGSRPVKMWGHTNPGREESRATLMALQEQKMSSVAGH